MKKDVITIKLEDGSYKDMEVVLLYKDNKTKQEYIIYKDLKENTEFYVAKYNKGINGFELDTNLTDKEFKMLEIILNNEIREDNDEIKN